MAEDNFRAPRLWYNGGMRRTLQIMLDELVGNRLVVMKIRTESGYVRMPVSWSAPWYQRLCREHTATRRRYSKARTIIRRVHAVAALRRMIAGDRTSTYAQRILAIIEQ